MNTNGAEKIEEIHGGVKKIHEDQLHLAHSVNGLTRAVETLASKIETFIGLHQKMVPMRLVIMMFIVVFFLIAGIEGVKTLFAMSFIG